MTAPSIRPRYLLDQSVMSHYRTNAAVERKVNELAVIGVLCSCVVTMDEARYSARNKADLSFITELYGRVFQWLPMDDPIEEQVADIRAALWRSGAGRGAQTTDVQIAALALMHEATVIHNDTDFITIQRAVPELRQLRIVPDQR
ncbi:MULTISPECIES: type II toxin-antitoxin system VapC family toxin [Nocardia]|uniref:type II toxin-antitoxin system VapC family toxin n=1 Tax=Nocardia TaxID=1817 RepID=UPI000D694DB1|nr:MULTISPECIES: PIN domain-containing protein [Nocardia]